MLDRREVVRRVREWVEDNQIKQIDDTGYGLWVSVWHLQPFLNSLTAEIDAEEAKSPPEKSCGTCKNFIPKAMQGTCSVGSEITTASELRCSDYRDNRVPDKFCVDCGWRIKGSGYCGHESGGWHPDSCSYYTTEDQDVSIDKAEPAPEKSCPTCLDRQIGIEMRGALNHILNRDAWHWMKEAERVIKWWDDAHGDDVVSIEPSEPSAPDKSCETCEHEPECHDQVHLIQILESSFRHAINASCTCGGRGPEDGACPACMVWHYCQGHPIPAPTTKRVSNEQCPTCEGRGYVEKEATDE